MFWETSHGDRVARESWQIFKEVLHRAQEQVIPRRRKLGKEGKRSICLTRKLLVKLREKKQMHKQWKQTANRKSMEK